MSCKPVDLVGIPFPYSDLKAEKRRPVLVITKTRSQDNPRDLKHYWLTYGIIKAIFGHNYDSRCEAITMRLSQDLKPVSYFKNNMAEILRRLNENRGTMIITQNGEAKAAIMDIHAYEELEETLSMLEMIAQGNKSLAAGRYRPADQVLKEFEERIEKDFS
jgi:prevent-host-death family protein